MAEHYDVIIIGTRCRWRHAGAHPGALGQTDPAARAGRVPAAGEGELGSRRGSSSRVATSRPDTWRDTGGKHVPARRSTTTSAARRSSTALRCTGSGRAISASSSHVDGDLARRGPSAMRSSSRGTRKAEWLYQVHGSHGEDPTEGTWSRQYPFPAVSPRAPDPADPRRPRTAGYHPFHAPCGILLDEAEPCRQHVHPMHLVRRLPVPGACEIRCRDHRRPPGTASTRTSLCWSTPR